MPSNHARSIPLNLLAWCCYISLRTVRGHPALQGPLQGHDLAPAIHSSHEDFLATVNDHHGLNRGEGVNHNQLWESQQLPHQVDPQSPDLDVERDYLNIEPENGICSTNVAKHPKTVKDGHFATPIPQSLNHGSNTSSPFSSTTSDRSGLSVLKDHCAGHQFNHLQSSPVPSALSASFHPNIFTSKPMLPFTQPHEAGKPWDDLINVPGLHKKLLHSEFGKITDSTWLSSFGKQVPSKQSTNQYLPNSEFFFQSMSSHGFESSHGDLSVSQLSMQFDQFDDLLWPPPWAHSPCPELKFSPQQIQAQYLLEHSASQYNPDGTQHNFQGQAGHQPSEDHTCIQGLETSRSLISHSPGDSFEKMDKNHGSMHASTEWDPELAKLNIPDVSKDHDLLKKLVNDFHDRTRGKLEIIGLLKVDLPRNDLKHLPVTFFRDKHSSLYLIRVSRAPEYRNPKSNASLACQNAPQKILKQFCQLINWLLFINTAVLRRIHTPGSISETSEEEDSNYRLIGWLFEETFEPSNSWPVVGKITPQVAQGPGKTFGPIQEIIITCLSSLIPLKRELQTAIMLLQHYYQYEFPQIWEELGNGQLFDFKSLIKDAIESKMIIGNGLNGGKWIEKLGNFPVRSLESIPKELQEENFRSNLFKKYYKVKAGTKEEEFRKYIEDKISPSRKDCAASELSRVNFNPKEYPIWISNRVRNVKVLKNGMVWPRNHRNDSAFRPSHILFRLNRFLDHLNVCFSKLMTCKAGKGIKPGGTLELLFFSWFRKILFNPGQDKLPLLGHFNLEKERRVDSFSAQDFNEIQDLMLNIISNPNSHLRNFQAALSVLGYWLKNEQGGLYNQLFKNDNEYWDELIKLIKSEFFSNKRKRKINF